MIEPVEDERHLWDREYDHLQIIPSSTRESPSKALLLFAELLDLSNKVVLDAGCGTGRNAIYLARRGCEVHAIDYSESGLAVLDVRAKKAGVRDRLHVSSTRFPPLLFPDQSFDAVLDIYVLCHLLDDHIRERYLREARRVLKPNGQLITVHFGTEDEYYRPMRKHDGGPIIRDPANGIRKRLLSEQEAKALFAETFANRYFAKFEFDDVIAGETYRRSILSAVLQP